MKKFWRFITELGFFLGMLGKLGEPINEWYKGFRERKVQYNLEDAVENPPSNPVNGSGVPPTEEMVEFPVGSGNFIKKPSV